MKRLICFVLTLALLLAAGVTASATGGIQTRELFYRGISIYVNGAELVPRDVNGKSTEPFIIEGTTYLPVRALASALGLDVGWDGKTNTVTLSSGGEVSMGSGEAEKTEKTVTAEIYYRDVKIYLDGTELVPTDVNGKYAEPFLMGGSTYLPLRAVASALGLYVSWDEATDTITLSDRAPCIVRETLTTLSQSGAPTECTEKIYTYAPGMTIVESFTDGQPEFTETLGYDQAGRLVSSVITDPHAAVLCTETLSYDQAGALLSLVHDGTDGEYRKYWNYNADGSIATIYTYDSALGSSVHSTIDRYSYDENGRLVRLFVHEPWGNTYDTVYSYDESGRLVRESTTANEVVGVASGTTVIEYGYDDAGRLATKDTLTRHYEYTYSADGLPTGYTCSHIDGRLFILVIEYEA